MTSTKGKTSLGLASLAFNTSLTLARQLLGGFVGFVTVVIVARILGPEGNGQYAVAMLLPNMLASFLNFGISPANVYYLGSGKINTTTVLYAVITLFMIIASAGIGIGALCIIFFGNIWFPGIPSKILWLVLAIFPISLLQSFLAGIFQCLQKFRTYNLILLAKPLTTLIAVMIIVYAHKCHLENIILAMICSSLFVLILTMVEVYKEVDTKRDKVTAIDVKKYIRKATSYGIRAHLSNILAFINYKADIFLVNFLLNPAAAGIYTVAVQIVERLWLLSQSVGIVLFPRLSELNANESKRKQLTPILSRIVIFMTLIAALILACLASPMVNVFFGESYWQVVPALLILLPGIVAGSGARILANDIAARGRPELNMYFSLIVVTVNIIGNFLLIPRFGLKGAALATTFAYALNLTMRLEVYKHLSGNHYLDSLIFKANDLRMLSTTVKKMLARKNSGATRDL